MNECLAGKRFSSIEMSTDDETQRLSLVGNPIQNDMHAQRIEDVTSLRGRRSTFWTSLFQRKRTKDNGEEEKEEDDLEGSALLNSSPELLFDSRRRDDEELDDYRDDGGDPTTRQKLLASKHHINDSDSAEDDDSINDDDDDEEDEWEDKNQWRRSTDHRPLFNGSDPDHDLLGMHSSDPTLRYKSTEYGHNFSADDDEESNTSDSKEEDDDDHDDEEMDNKYKSPEGFERPVPPHRPLRNFLQRSQSVSSNSYYSDNRSSDNGLLVDSNNRKNIHERIQGFGSATPPDVSQNLDRQISARNLRQKLMDFTSAYRMRKMAIGTEDTLQRKTWVERFDEVVDRVLPADPELDGYIDAFKVRGQATVPIPHDQVTGSDSEGEYPIRHDKAVQSFRDPPGLNIRPTSRDKSQSTSHRRKELGAIDDPSYIMYLECELQNKELELNSWKRRVKELESEVKRLKEQQDEDDCQSRDSNSIVDNGGEGESEIEWQTGVAEEGILIDVDDSPHSTHQIHAMGSGHDKVSKQASTFVVSHAPDGPNGDNEPQIVRQTPIDRGGDDFFSSPRSSESRESKTIWIDITPSTQREKGFENAFSTLSDNDGKVDLDDDDDDDDDDEEEGSESNKEGGEEKEKNGPDEGILILLDEPTQEAMTSRSAVTNSVLISDDDNDDDDDTSENEEPKGCENLDALTPSSVSGEFIQGNTTPQFSLIDM